VTGPDASGTVTETTSDGEGRFRLSLSPGSYTIHPVNLTDAVSPTAQPLTVTVTAGQFTTVTVPFDSGLSAPATSPSASHVGPGRSCLPDTARRDTATTTGRWSPSPQEIRRAIS